MAFIQSLPFVADANHIIPNTSPLPSQRIVSSLPRMLTQPASAKKRKSSKLSTKEGEKAAYDFLFSLGLSNEDCKRIISRLPRLSSETNLVKTAEPMLSFLRLELHLRPKQISRVVRNAPHILFRSPLDFALRLEFLENVVRLSAESLPVSIAKCPHILWMDLKQAARVVELVVNASPNISPNLLGSVFERVPQALVTAPGKIVNNIDIIRQAGVSEPAHMGRIFTKTPLALVYDAKKSLAKRLTYLSNDLGLSTTTVGKVLVSTPEILEWSLEKKLKPYVKLLESLIGENNISGVIDKIPFIFGVENILDRVLWLRDEVELNNEQIQCVLKEAPAILTYSVTGNLAPKWTFLHETMGGTKEDVVAAPREALCINLQQRAMPRYAFLATSGKTEIAVMDVLRGSDVEFCKKVAKCETEVFRNYVDNDTYLLFFSRLM